ncbi:MAG: copper chaperone PCu(A)C [Gemmatimonadetes bacterium]|nr:copper chaperone PCu(A)C [Gemmatimonadota bacterium]
MPVRPAWPAHPAPVLLFMLVAGACRAPTPVPPVAAAPGPGFMLALEDAWAEPGRAGQGSRAFLRLASSATVPVAVAAVRTRAAAGVRLAGRIDGTPARLAAQGGFVIPAGTGLRMGPGGTWLALEHLAVDLLPGDSVGLALAMPGAVTLVVRIEVRELTSAGVPGGGAPLAFRPGTCAARLPRAGGLPCPA